MENILILGGAGYLGTRICEQFLRAGKKVTCFDNLMYGQNSSLIPFSKETDFNFVFGDVRDEATVSRELRNADVVIPLAAIVGAPACDKRPYDATTTNHDSISMLSKLLSRNQRVIFPNSNSGYGTTPAGEITTEETPLNPLSLYGSSKAEAEKVLSELENSVIFRLATVFGPSLRPRSDLLVNDFVKQAMIGNTIVMYQPQARRNFVYIGDVARAFQHASENFEMLKGGKIFNLGCDELNITKEGLAEKIREHFPSFRWQLGAGEDPDKRDYLVSNEKLKEYGFCCDQTSFDSPIIELKNLYNVILPGADKTTNK